MIVNVRGKNLTIDDEMAAVMKKNYMDVDALTCESYIEIYFTDESVAEHILPNLDDIFTTKSEEELSYAVNDILRKNIHLIKH